MGTRVAARLAEHLSLAGIFVRGLFAFDERGAQPCREFVTTGLAVTETACGFRIESHRIEYACPILAGNYSGFYLASESDLAQRRSLVFSNDVLTWTVESEHFL